MTIMRFSIVLFFGSTNSALPNIVARPPIFFGSGTANLRNFALLKKVYARNLPLHIRLGDYSLREMAMEKVLLELAISNPDIRGGDRIFLRV